MADNYQERVDAAIARQKAAHKALRDGGEPLHTDQGQGGPTARDTRAIALDRLVQVQEVLETGLGLPTGGTHGLTFEDDARAPLSDDDRKRYQALETLILEAGDFTDDEIDKARDRLDDNIADHVMLDPGTAEAKA